MTRKIEHVEVITSGQRRRRWSVEEKTAIVQETCAPGMTVSLVAPPHGIAPNQVFTWRRLYVEGALSAVGSGEEVVPASSPPRRKGDPIDIPVLIALAHIEEADAGITAWSVMSREERIAVLSNADAFDRLLALPLTVSDQRQLPPG